MPLYFVLCLNARLVNDWSFCKLSCRNKGIIFIAIDHDRPLSEQGPFDIVLQKLSGKEWREVLEGRDILEINCSKGPFGTKLEKNYVMENHYSGNEVEFVIYWSNHHLHCLLNSDFDSKFPAMELVSLEKVVNEKLQHCK